jgi:hypothetical protein
MAGQKLAYTVVVADDKGNQHTFGTATENLPAWARKAITNPAAWADGSAPDEADTDNAADTDGPPPKSGAGSGAAAWRAYAKHAEVEVDDKASREDVIAALEARGIATEAAPTE